MGVGRWVGGDGFVRCVVVCLVWLCSLFSVRRVPAGCGCFFEVGG